MSSTVAQSKSSLPQTQLTDQMRMVMGEVEHLPAEDQDLIAAMIMREVSKSHPVSDVGEASEESLHTLLQEARQELREGQTKLMSKECVISDD